jgi:hypothetical protein
VELWKRQEEYKQGHWTQLKYVPFPLRATYIVPYISAALIYCDALEIIFLDDRARCDRQTPMLMNEFDWLKSRLHEFPRLAELEVSLYTDDCI